MKRLEQLRIKIFADGASKAGILDTYQKPYIKGFTTNPTLMHKAGIVDYRSFAQDLLNVVRDRPVSFEVFADDIQEMEYQAREIASWADNVYVKIPILNTKRETTLNLVKRLSLSGVKINVTAIMTPSQVSQVAKAVVGGAPCFISLFAGRVADTGRDPLPIMRIALQSLQVAPNAELIWASTRELLNIFQADSIGCHIITVTNDILNKLHLIDKDLNEYSLETAQMFHEDAIKANLSL